jgi:hypothetical protein
MFVRGSTELNVELNRHIFLHSGRSMHDFVQLLSPVLLELLEGNPSTSVELQCWPDFNTCISVDLSAFYCIFLCLVFASFYQKSVKLWKSWTMDTTNELKFKPVK